MKWSIEKANEWKQKTGWLFGFNYVTSSAVNSTEMWQDQSYDRESIKRELALAAETGFNSCRVFLQYLVWANEGERFIHNFSDFCDIAKSAGLSVMPILFDDCNFAQKEPYLGVQDAPRPGVSNSGWTPCPGASVIDDPSKEQSLCEYVKNIVSTFKGNKQIVVWDLYNEPGNNGQDQAQGSGSLALMEKAFTWAREAKPSQPLTVAVWNPADYNFAICDHVDIVSFHDYQSLNKTQKLISKLKEYNRPILCTEWLNRPGGNTFENHLPMFGREITGAYNWGLILGKTQTNLHGSTIFGEPDPNPVLWQHDLYHSNQRPYNSEEITFIKKFAAKM